MTTRNSSNLTLKDKLSRLTFAQACKLLAPNGSALISQGGKFTIDIDQQVRLTKRQFRVEMDTPVRSIVTIRLDKGASGKLSWHCSTSKTPCAEVGAALSLILEEKVALGLAIAPPDALDRAGLSNVELNAIEVMAREKRASEEKMVVRSDNPKTPWTDYLVTNKTSGKSYRVALRGSQPGESYCTCPDYRKNTLGICKHTIHVMQKIRRKFSAAQLRRSFNLKNVIVFVQYGNELQLRVGIPDKLDTDASKMLKRFRDKPVEDIAALVRAVGKLEAMGHSVTIYPDAEEFIQRRCWQSNIKAKMAEIRSNPAKHPLRKELLKTELLPYQLDGIAFSVGAGRAILADDMGLGKTIQGVGVAALLEREAGISRVLVVCPASLKTQWRSEIYRFSDFDAQLIVGPADKRAEQYINGCLFTVCNYEQVLRDLITIEQVHWDLIILDEAQRIKNWQAKTSRVIKSLRSTFALALTGTPIENRIEELHSIVEFIDDRRLGPDFRFHQRHRILADNGRVTGYQNLGELRRLLQPVLLRRTRASVLSELPARTTDIIRIEPTEEQLDIHSGQMRIVSSVIGKSFLTEMDLLKLQKALLMCRMSADSTMLCDKQEPGYSSKLKAIADLFDRLFQHEQGKVVLFSEWTTMLTLIEPLLKKRKIGYVRMDGKVPQQKRMALVNSFRDDDSCRLFMTTNAGSTGLNLQFADTVINVDLPWTPALLEQRIGRVHRMGQKSPVHVFILITENTIEESLLSTLSAKHELALAVLDPDSDVDSVDLVSGIDGLKQRLEVLLGAMPEVATDESQRRDIKQKQQAAEDRQRMAEAGGQMLGAAFGFLGEMLPPQPETDASRAFAQELKQRFSQCVERDEHGKPQLIVTLPNDAALDNLAESLARLLGVQRGT